MIPVSDANRFIGALNRIAEGVTMLAAAIEETAWEGFEDHAGMPGACLLYTSDGCRRYAVCRSRWSPYH